MGEIVNFFDFPLQMTSLSRLSRLKSAAAFLSAGWGGEEGIVGELQELQKQMNNVEVKSSTGKFLF